MISSDRTAITFGSTVISSDRTRPIFYNVILRPGRRPFWINDDLFDGTTILLSTMILRTGHFHFLSTSSLPRDDDRILATTALSTERLRSIRAAPSRRTRRSIVPLTTLAVCKASWLPQPQDHAPNANSRRPGYDPASQVRRIIRPTRVRQCWHALRLRESSGQTARVKRNGSMNPSAAIKCFPGDDGL